MAYRFLVLVALTLSFQSAFAVDCHPRGIVGGFMSTTFSIQGNRIYQDRREIPAATVESMWGGGLRFNFLGGSTAEYDGGKFLTVMGQTYECE